MNAELLNRITFNNNQCGGKPCIRNMRIRVKDVLELLACGLKTDQIIEEFPSLETEDIRASLLYAATKL